MRVVAIDGLMKQRRKVQFAENLKVRMIESLGGGTVCARPQAFPIRLLAHSISGIWICQIKFKVLLSMISAQVVMRCQLPAMREH